MRLRDNDVGGLLWDRSIRRERAVSTRQHAPAKVLPPLPQTTWTPPIELPSLAGVKRLCIDVETRDPDLSILGPGVRRPNCYVVGLAVGTDDGRRWYLPTRHEGGGNLDEGLIWRWAREELNAFTGRVAGAKIDYDLDWLAENGVTFPHCAGFDDVQIAEPLLDEWRYEFSLNALAQDYFGERKVDAILNDAAAANGWTTEKQIKGNLWRLPASYAGAYAEGDVDLPLRILPLQMARIEAEGLSTIYSIESRLIPILVAMRRRGVPVNVNGAEEVRQGLVKRRDEYLAQVRHLAGPKAELLIPESLAPALRERGIQIPLTAGSKGKPETRKPSITKALFEKYAGDDLIDAIAGGRKINTIINTFLDGTILGQSINGRLHCEFKQLKDDGGGTIARIAAANPNLSTIPARDKEMSPLIRGLFPAEEGEQWQSSDESQIEFRLGAHFGIGPNAEEVRQKYRDDPDTDFHNLAAEMMGIDTSSSTERKRIKSIHFGKGYGARGPKLAYLMKCSVAEAEDFIAEYDRKIPFASKSFDAAQRWAEKHGYVTSILGRKQRFSLWVPRKKNWDNPERPLRYEDALAAYGPNIERYKTYAAWNRKLQSSNADIMKKGMVDGWEAGLCAPDALGPYLITIYDELDVSVPPTKRGDEAAKELDHIMANAVKLSVPVLVKSKRGRTWGECG